MYHLCRVRHWDLSVVRVQRSVGQRVYRVHLMRHWEVSLIRMQRNVGQRVHRVHRVPSRQVCIGWLQWDR